MRLISQITPVLALLTLSACSTPLERCISKARSDVHRTEREISRTEANIRRGYALHYQSVPYTWFGQCETTEGEIYACPQTRFRQVSIPVAIDVAAEERKLAHARELLAKQRVDAGPAVTECRALHPAG